MDGVVEYRRRFQRSRVGALLNIKSVHPNEHTGAAATLIDSARHGGPCIRNR